MQMVEVSMFSTSVPFVLLVILLLVTVNVAEAAFCVRIDRPRSLEVKVLESTVMLFIAPAPV